MDQVCSLVPPVDHSDEIQHHMEIDEIVEEPVEQQPQLPGDASLSPSPWRPQSVKVAVAVGMKSESSALALKWVLDNGVVSAGEVLQLVHVQAPIRFVPTPMGNTIAISQASEDIVKEFKLKRFLDTEKMLSEYRAMCDRKQVICEVCCLEGVLVHKELVNQISKLCIMKLVLGTSSHGRLTKAFKGPGISSFVAKHAPEFCTVIVVCKGKLHLIREATGS